MLKRILPTALAAVAVIAASAPVAAEGSAAPPVRAELIDGWRLPDGTRMGAVRLVLAPGWKTYWRAPGDAGIPPQFDWSGSRNLRGVSVNWPTPTVFGQNGMTSVGYKDQVVLPLAIAARRADEAVEIDLTLDIGVCHDICIPERLHLSGTLSSDAGAPVPSIAAALAERPYSAAEAGARGVVCTLAPTADGLAITATLSLPDTGGAEHVVIEAGRADVWVSEATTARRGGTLVAQAEMVASGSSPLSLDRSAIRFTVLGSDHAVDLRGCTAG